MQLKVRYVELVRYANQDMVLYFRHFSVGGIYTVIRSKTSASVNEMGDQYICIGPYMEMKARAEVEEEDFPPHHPLGKISS